MKKDVKTIFFDVGGVLRLEKNFSEEKWNRRFTKGVHEYVISKIKIPLDQYFDAIEDIFSKGVDGSFSEEEVLNKLSLNLKIRKKKLKKIYLKAYKKNFKLNKELLKKAIQLKKIGYKTAILSDMWPISKEVLIPKKLSEKFTEAIISCDVGKRKPHSEIYKLSLKKLKTKPSEAVFIDNQKWNIEAAKKLGIKTIHFKNNNQLFRNNFWKSLFF